MEAKLSERVAAFIAAAQAYQQAIRALEPRLEAARDRVFEAWLAAEDAPDELDLPETPYLSDESAGARRAVSEVRAFMRAVEKR